MRTFTVSVAGSERHWGEKPHTYVVCAISMGAAKQTALAFHHATHLGGVTAAMVRQNPEYGPDHDTCVITGPGYTFAGLPDWPADLAGREWNDCRHLADPDSGWLKSLGVDFQASEEPGDCVLDQLRSQIIEWLNERDRVSHIESDHGGAYQL